MKSGFLMRAAALAIGAIGLVAASQSWIVTYAATDSGHRMGDPEAPLQLIEFVSYTCPHCAIFERESEGALKLGYVHEGKVAVEVKHLIRDQVDLAVALVARCGPTDKFFGNHTALMLAQPEWFATGRALSQAQRNRWNSGSIAQRMQAIGRDLGLHDLMQSRGYEPSEIDRCLADSQEMEAVFQRSQADAERYGITGTPSFIVNGEQLEGVHSWTGLNKSLTEMTEE